MKIVHVVGNAIRRDEKYESKIKSTTKLREKKKSDLNLTSASNSCTNLEFFEPAAVIITASGSKSIYISFVIGGVHKF